MSIYDDARQVANELFGEFKQGDVRYIGLTPQPGGTPDDPLPPIPTNVSINATVRPVSTKYVDGSHIVQSDKQVSMPNAGVVPTMSGSIRIDGATHKIIEIMPRPAAGDPVVWVLVVRR